MRIRAYVLLFVVISVSGFLSGAPLLKVDMTVQLPPFLIEASRSGRIWRYARISGYEILSDCSEEKTREVALAFRRAHGLLDVLLSPHLQVQMDAPHMLIFCDKRFWLETEQDAVEAMLHPEAPIRLPSLDVYRDPANKRFFSNLMLSDIDLFVTFTLVSEGGSDADATNLTPEFVDELMYRRAPALPSWFTASFRRFYKDLEFLPEGVRLRTDQWAFAARFAPVARGKPASDSLRPIEELWSAAMIGSTWTSSVWLDQIELFIAWSIDPAGGRSDGFAKFVDGLSAGLSTEAFFKECFGCDYVTCKQRLLEYAAKPHELLWNLPLDMAHQSEIAVHDANRVEIARMKGEWERLETRYVAKNASTLESAYASLAQRTLRRAYDRGERDPQLVATFGLLESQIDHKNEARTLLEDAFQRGMIRPRANYELGRLRYNFEFEHSTRDDGRLTRQQTDSVLEPLIRATLHSPRVIQVYQFIAKVCSLSEAPPSIEALAALKEGVRYFPSDRSLIEQVEALQRNERKPQK